jgi:hypothetical protein
VSDPVAAPGWNEYKLLVLDQLEGLKRQVENLERKMDAFRADDIANVKVEIALLKQRASIYGLVAGSVPGFVAAAIWYLSK